jgi:urease accessory protein
LESYLMMRRIALLLLLLFLPIPADAHLVSTGFGSYYDGMAHFVFTPADWLFVLAIGLLAGLSGAAAGRVTLVALPMGWVAGGFLGMLWPGTGDWPLTLILSFGVVGLLVSLDRKLPPLLAGALAVVLGAMHGFLNGTSMSGGDRTWLAILGVGSAVFVLATVVPAIVVSLRPAWTKIAVRVLGSWIAAVGLLMLGWLMRGKV